MVIGTITPYSFFITKAMSSEDVGFYEIHKDLTKTWLKLIISKNNTYEEPILGEFSMNMLQICCESFRQQTAVFILAAELLENYARITETSLTNMELAKNVANDCLLKSLCVISISSKCIGAKIEVKPRILQHIFAKISRNTVTLKEILTAEMEIMNALQYNIPISSQKLDDLQILFEACKIVKFKLTSTMLEVCEELLVLCQIKYKTLFNRLKNIYTNNRDHFKRIYTIRLFLPCGILLAAAFYIDYHILYDIEVLQRALSNFSGIQEEDLNILKNEIRRIVLESKRK